MKRIIAICITVVMVTAQVFAEGQSESNTAQTKIEVWDYLTDSDVPQILADKFMEMNPGITIERTVFSTADMRTMMRPALTSGQAPDLFSYTPGPGYVGVFADAGVIIPLDDYFERFGWDKRFPEWVKQDVTYNGSIYSLPSEVTMVGVYYNKAIFKDLGLSVPATYEEFLAVAKTCKDAGVLPIILSSQNQWNTFHYESMFFSSFAGREGVGAVLNGKSGFDQPVFGRALDAFQDLIKKGYTQETPNAWSYDDANTAFKSGDGAMRFTGSWMINDYVTDMGDNVGFFTLPGQPGMSTQAPGGVGTVWCISKDSEYDSKEQALLLLDFMLSPKQIPEWYLTGTIPPVLGVQDVASIDGLSELFRDAVRLSQNPDGIGYNLDVYLSQEVNEATLGYMQELIALRIDGSEAAARKQAAFKK